MQDAGITPFAFANDGNWPAMGTFDQLNFRLNGYQFHVDLMAGKESWTDERVKNVFTTWESLLPVHQENPNGRTWEEAAAAVVNKEAGMMTIGTFIGSQFPDGDTSDLDFFAFPELNPEFGTGTVEAPIDGWMMAEEPVATRRLPRSCCTTSAPRSRQDAYLVEGPERGRPVRGRRPSSYSPLAAEGARRRRRGADRSRSSSTATRAPSSRRTSPVHVSRTSSPIRRRSTAILADMQEQAEVILGG